MSSIEKLRAYKPSLWGLAVIGLLGLNGVFVYYAAFRPDVLAAAMDNPVSLVFIVEAFVMMVFAAWLIYRLDFERPGWISFAILSVIGGLAFSVPFFILLHLRKRETR